jgi:hypothetical protein
MTAQPSTTTTTSTRTPRPTHRLTNLRPCRCVNCGRTISAGRGCPRGSRYTCPACTELYDRTAVADNYRRAVSAMVPNVADRFLVDRALFSLISRLGFSAPLVLQAVLDRAAWLNPATYVDVMALATEETRALGLNVQVG